MQTITRSVVRKLSRMKGRTIGISLVVSVAMAMLLCGLFTADVMTESIESYFEERKMPDVFVDLKAPVNASEVDAALAGRTDVEAYDARLKLAGVYDHGGEYIPVLFIGIEDVRQEDIDRLETVKGRFFEGTGEAVAVAGMEAKGIKKGATPHLELLGKRLNLTITGTVTGPEFVYTTAFADYTIPAANTLVVILLPLETLQDEMGLGHVVNEVLVLAKGGKGGEGAVGALDPLGVKAITYQEDHPSRYFMRIGAAKMENMLPVMSVIFMVVGFISIFMTMIRLVQSDSRYIGVMMSLGYSKGEITRAYLVLGLIIGSIGTILGIILGIWFTNGIMNTTTSFFGVNLPVVYPLSVMPFVYSILFTVLTTLLSVWIPIHLITRASVREALEYRPRVGVRLTGRKKASTSRLSKVTVMGLRNSVRNPKRTAVTVLVIALTIGVAGSWLIMMDSAMGYMGDQLDSDKWDVRADFLVPVEDASINASFLGLGAGDVRDIVPYTYIRGEASRGGSNKGTVVIATNGFGTIKDFDLREGSISFNSGNAVISSKLSQDLEAGIGKTITVTSGSKEVDLKVKGIVNDISQYTVYASKASMAPISPANQSSGVFIRLRTPDTAPDRANDVRAAPLVRYVVVHEDISSTLDEMMTMAQGFLGFFFFMNLCITIVVAGSSVIISTMERDVEYATLDTLGISKGKVAKAVLAEMSILGLASALLAVPFAYLFAEVLARVMEEVIFYFPIEFVLGSTLTTMIFGLVAVVISSYVPIRYARKVDTERTIRERTAG